jgi:hypothetical protein
VASSVDDKLTPQQADQLFNFLIRIVILLAEAPDRDLHAVYIHVMRLMRRALQVFHPMPFRMTYIIKLLEVRGGRGEGGDRAD